MRWVAVEKQQPVIIVGAGGHAVSVAESVLACGYELLGFLEDEPAKSSLLGRPVYSHPPAAHGTEGARLVIAVGDNYAREGLWRRFVVASQSALAPALIHPSASVSASATIGAGSVILQGAIVGSCARIGNLCIVNSGAVVEHECEMQDFASLAPKAAIGGRVRIGERSAISIGAVVKPGIAIGHDTVVGAQSYVNDNLPANVVAYGIPARVVRTRESSDSYLR